MNNFFFKPIDLEKDGELLSGFLEETVKIGNQHFESMEDYTNVYLKFIEERQPENQNWFALYYHGNTVIGFAGATQAEKCPEYGMISFLYLIPEKRKMGLGKELEKYALDQLRKSGCKKARLTVSSENHRAVEFYRKQGWEVLKEREEEPVIYLMGKAIDE